jgi:ABC-type uncharacterized transport system involved in gliding motility auxiliary subunit/ABC-type transport system involved in multi-copper enzyme maturation permease subunit
VIRRVWIIARREATGYFDHPTAYVLGVAFLGISLFVGFRSLYASGVASLRPFFDWLPVLYSVFIPAATMRSLAEEQRAGTLEWLLAQPLTETEVVLGKFLGCWLFVLAALAGTIPMALGVLIASSADPGIIVAQYAGAALLAAQLVGLGLWASSITHNQITAFIVASAISFMLFLIGLPVVQIGFPPVVTGALVQLSVVGHFGNVARGVIDLRDTLYFLSTTALFLTLAVSAVSRDRLSPVRAEYRRLRLGAAVVAALVLVLNLLGSHVRGRLDLTRDRLYTLADGTRDVLGGLDDLVQVKLYASNELPPEVQLQLRDVRDLLADMRRASYGHLAVTEVDPDKDKAAAAEASSLGIRPIEFNVLRADEFQVRRGFYGMAVVYADSRRAMPVIEQTSDLEFRLASAIAGMTARKKPRVAFLSGYGSKSPSEIQGMSENFADRYTLGTLELRGDSSGHPVDPDSTRVLVIAGPTMTIDSLAVERVRAFARAGGSVLILLDPVAFDQQAATPIPVKSGLDRLLQERGVRFNPNLVFDLASHERLTLGRQGSSNVVAAYPLWPVTVPVGVNAITRNLKALTLAWAGTLEITDSTKVVPILQTTAAAGLRSPSLPITPDQDWSVPPSQLGVRTVAVAIDPEKGEGQSVKPGRIVVVSDASFLDPQFVQSSPQNLVFLANAIDWLTQDESLIRIRSKDRTPPRLVFVSDAGRDALKWGNLLGVPLLFVLAGVVRVTGRRRRAERHWKAAVG